MSDKQQLADLMRGGFEASLTDRLARASKIEVHHFIPGHWFSAAASECASMYVAAHYYGCISVAQAYIEALGKFVAEINLVKTHKDVPATWKRIMDAGHIEEPVFDAALAIYDSRNDFHHLNRNVPTEAHELEARAERCILALQTIESELFGYTYSDEHPGQPQLRNPKYWPHNGPNQVAAFLRQKWS